MAHLMLEPLEGRDLPSGTLAAGIGPPPPPTDVVALTAPLGSTKGSIVSPRDSASGLPSFTPPIGSNKGSIVAGDGLGTTGREVPTQGIIAILIGLRAPTQPADAGATPHFFLLPYIEQENLFKQYRLA